MIGGNETIQIDFMGNELNSVVVACLIIGLKIIADQLFGLCSVTAKCQHMQRSRTLDTLSVITKATSLSKAESKDSMTSRQAFPEGSLNDGYSVELNTSRELP
jgi:hypothetical protein